MAASDAFLTVVATWRNAATAASETGPTQSVVWVDEASGPLRRPTTSMEEIDMTIPVLGTRARLLSCAAAAMIAVGACSSAATPAPPTQAPPTAAPPTAAPASSAPASEAPASSAPASAAAGTTYTLTVATGAGSIGKYLTGEDGKTLYTFKKDTAGAGTSACSAATCVANWPAFTLDAGEKAVGGAGASGTIATFTRADGKVQVTYNGAPLYYFAGDSAAGDTNGQGVGGFWFVAAP